jgi:hypothetical protein
MMFYINVIMTTLNIIIFCCLFQASKIWFDKYGLTISQVNKLVIQINKLTNIVNGTKDKND